MVWLSALFLLLAGAPVLGAPDCSAAGDDGCPSEDDDTGLAQLNLRKHHFAAAQVPVRCTYGETTCSGNECCPGTPETGDKTYPCPDAAAGWNICQTPDANAVRPSPVSEVIISTKRPWEPNVTCLTATLSLSKKMLTSPCVIGSPFQRFQLRDERVIVSAAYSPPLCLHADQAGVFFESCSPTSSVFTFMRTQTFSPILNCYCPSQSDCLMPCNSTSRAKLGLQVTEDGAVVVSQDYDRFWVQWPGADVTVGG
mmetsp:Transcript_108625/g.232018  ORF Transcript_108625/g.232018 Transcript_108625/m.232018 type:complete len:254 (-) Transcript_108625:7-768(-)